MKKLPEGDAGEPSEDAGLEPSSPQNASPPDTAKEPYLLSLKGLFNDKEAPTLEAFASDWQRLDRLGRVVWSLRLVLFVLMIVSLFMTWDESYYRDNPINRTALSGWQLLLELGGWTCGAFLIPLLALIFFGVWSILRPGGRMVELYRVALVLWVLLTALLAFGGLSSAVGPIVGFVLAVLAFVVEIANLIVRRKAT